MTTSTNFGPPTQAATTSNVNRLVHYPPHPTSGSSASSARFTAQHRAEPRSPAGNWHDSPFSPTSHVQFPNTSFSNARSTPNIAAASGATVSVLSTTAQPALQQQRSYPMATFHADVFSRHRPMTHPNGPPAQLQYGREAPRAMLNYGGFRQQQPVFVHHNAPLSGSSAISQQQHAAMAQAGGQRQNQRRFASKQLHSPKLGHRSSTSKLSHGSGIVNSDWREKGTYGDGSSARGQAEPRFDNNNQDTRRLEQPVNTRGLKQYDMSSETLPTRSVVHHQRSVARQADKVRHTGVAAGQRATNRLDANDARPLEHHSTAASTTGRPRNTGSRSGSTSSGGGIPEHSMQFVPGSVFRRSGVSIGAASSTSSGAATNADSDTPLVAEPTTTISVISPNTSTAMMPVSEYTPSSSAAVMCASQQAQNLPLTYVPNHSISSSASNQRGGATEQQPSASSSVGTFGGLQRPGYRQGSANDATSGAAPTASTNTESGEGESGAAYELSFGEISV